jgi:hypothetical protein
MAPAAWKPEWGTSRIDPLRTKPCGERARRPKHKRKSSSDMAQWRSLPLGPHVHDFVNEVPRRRRYRLKMMNELSKTNVLAYEALPPGDIWRSDNLVLTAFASTRPITTAHIQLVSVPNLEVCRKHSKTRDAKTAVKTNVSEVSSTAPLRLDVAAQLAFPAGGMTAAGLRREAAKGRLAIERIAGKDYTTLADIEEMRALCRTNPRVLDSGSGPQKGMRKQLDHQRWSEANSHRMRRWRSPRS